MALLLITLGLLFVVLPFFDPKSVAMATIFTEEPQDQNVTVGGTVTFRCMRHQSQGCTVLWYHMVKQTYLSRGKEVMAVYKAGGHYSIAAKSPNDFSLTIHNVTENDASAYQCVCFVGRSEFSRPAQLVIFVPPFPEYPSCRITALEETLVVGQRLNFHCSSLGGKPGADLKWIRGKDEELEAEFLKSPHSISIYRTYLRPQDFGMVYTCFASSPALTTQRKCTVGPLYPTSVVQIDIIPEADATELKPLSFGCSANFTEFGVRDFPPVLNFSWYINDYLVDYGMDGIILDYDRQFIFMNQTTHLPRNTQVSCEAFGPNGSLGNATVIINNEGEIYEEVTGPSGGILASPKKKSKFDIRPIIFINAGGLMLLATMILIVVCVPKQCRCLKKKQQSALRRRDSRYADMQCIQTNGCPSPLLMTPENNLNTYESTDSDTESSKGMSGNGSIPTVTTMSQNQQVQATLHVVVHSANNQAQTTTLKACSTDEYDADHSLYHELPPMPNTPPPPPPPPTDSPQKCKNGLYSSPVKLGTKTSPTKWNTMNTRNRSHSVLSYEHIPAEQNQYAPTTCTATSTTAGCYVRTLPLPGHHTKILTSCLRCNHSNKANNNHFATYHRSGDSVGVVYENIPLPPHTCDCPPPAPL